MKKISWGCVTIGTTSIVLAVLNALTVFFPTELFRYFIKSIIPSPGFNEYMEIITNFRGIQLLAQSIMGIFSNTNILDNNIILSVIGYFLSLLLAISGIGTMWVKSWGRTFGYIYSKIIIVIAIISIPVFLIHFFRLPFGGILSELYVKKTALEFYFIILFFNLLYPLILLIFFSCSQIKEKFSARNV